MMKKYYPLLKIASNGRIIIALKVLKFATNTLFDVFAKRIFHFDLPKWADAIALNRAYLEILH